MPIRAINDETMNLVVDATEGPPLPVVRLDGLRVLVVDDEPDARRLLSKVLEEAGADVAARWARRRRR